MAEPLRAIVADGQALVSELLTEQLSSLPYIKVVAQTSNARRLLELVKQRHPDVVLLDGQLPGSEGLDIVRVLRRRAPSLKLVLLTVHESDEFLFESVRVGVDAYLVKTTTGLRELRHALEAVGRGESYISPLSLHHAIRANASRAPSAAGKSSGGLSQREREILRWLARGLSTKEIAVNSGIRHATVRNHISSLYRKVGVPTRAGLVLYALRSGVIPPVGGTQAPSRD